MSTVMQHKDVTEYLKSAQLQQNLNKLILYKLDGQEKKLIFKDENDEIIATLSTSFLWDEDNSKLVFLNKEIQNFIETLEKEYRNAIRNGFVGTKQEYFETRDYT